MTLVHVDLRVPTPTGEAPAEGYLECVPVKRRNEPDHIVLPAPFPAVLDAGKVTLDLAPGAWRITERTRTGIVRVVLVPDVATIAYAALLDDPTA